MSGAMLTPRQRDCAAAIETLTVRLGRPPRYEEVREVLGLAGRGGINRLAHRLAERGWIAQRPIGEHFRLVLLKPVPPVACPRRSTHRIEITPAGHDAMADYRAAMANRPPMDRFGKPLS